MSFVDKLRKEQFCVNCGAKIYVGAEICPKCGARQPLMERESPKKNPGLAAVLSVFFTGLGQIYNGQFLKALIFFIIYYSIIAIAFASDLATPELAPSGIILGAIFAVPVWIWGIIDAYRSAEEINAGKM